MNCLIIIWVSSLFHFLCIPVLTQRESVLARDSLLYIMSIGCVFPVMPSSYSAPRNEATPTAVCLPWQEELRGPISTNPTSAFFLTEESQLALLTIVPIGRS